MDIIMCGGTEPDSSPPLHATQTHTYYKSQQKGISLFEVMDKNTNFPEEWDGQAFENILPQYVDKNADNCTIQVECDKSANFKKVIYQIIKAYDIKLDATAVHNIIAHELSLRETNDDEKENENKYFENFCDKENEIFSFIRNHPEYF